MLKSQMLQVRQYKYPVLIGLPYCGYESTQIENQDIPP